MRSAEIYIGEISFVKIKDKSLEVSVLKEDALKLLEGFKTNLISSETLLKGFTPDRSHYMIMTLERFVRESKAYTEVLRKIAYEIRKIGPT
jgi:hypothetical protein